MGDRSRPARRRAAPWSGARRAAFSVDFFFGVPRSSETLPTGVHAAAARHTTSSHEIAVSLSCERGASEGVGCPGAVAFRRRHNCVFLLCLCRWQTAALVSRKRKLLDDESGDGTSSATSSGEDDAGGRLDHGSGTLPHGPPTAQSTARDEACALCSRERKVGEDFREVRNVHIHWARCVSAAARVVPAGGVACSDGVVVGPHAGASPALPARGAHSPAAPLCSF